MTFQELVNLTVATRAAKKYSEKTIVMPCISGNIIIVAEYFERMSKCDKFIAIKRKSSLKVTILMLRTTYNNTYLPMMLKDS